MDQRDGNTLAVMSEPIRGESSSHGDKANSNKKYGYEQTLVRFLVDLVWCAFAAQFCANVMKNSFTISFKLPFS